MEQTELQQRVWQRVRGQTPEQPDSWLRQLLADQAAEAALWQQLGSRHGGIYAQIARQKREQLNCLRGIWLLAVGQPWKPVGEPPAEPPELRRSAARGLALWRVFDDHSRDPEFGPVFQSLRDQQRQHCRLTLELLSPPHRRVASGR